MNHKDNQPPIDFRFFLQKLTLPLFLIVIPFLSNDSKTDYPDNADAFKTFTVSLCAELYDLQHGLYSGGHSRSDKEYNNDPRFCDRAGALIPSRQQPQAPNLFVTRAGPAVVVIYNHGQKRYAYTVNGIHSGH